MTLNQRRLIALGFITFFIIVTPLVILYTTGFRYNLKKGKIEKTGILYIDSRPKKADIYINDKFQQKTPARFPTLLPDTYKIEVKKEGYNSWVKELPIKSNLTTFAKNIILFKESLPFNLIQGEIKLLIPSENREKIIYSVVRDNFEELRLYNFRSKTDVLINQYNVNNFSQFEFLEWSPSQNKILLNQQVGDYNKYLIIDTEFLKIKDLFDITRLNFNAVKWDSSNDNYLYGLRSGILYRIDLYENKTENLFADRINDFEAGSNNIYYITVVFNESFLNSRAVVNGQAMEPIKIKLPSPSNFRLMPSSSEYLILLDQLSQDLFVVHSDAFGKADPTDSIIFQDKAKNIFWSDNQDKLLIVTDFELSYLDFKTYQKIFVTRYGEPIKQAFWYKDDKHIIYQVGNSIRAIEAEDIETKNDLKLVEMENISNILADYSSENLYFKAGTGSNQGIYNLELQ